MTVPRSQKRFPATAERVQQNTDPEVNEQIRRETEAHFAHAALAESRALEDRLRELDQEWDVERTLQTNYGVIAILGITLGALVTRPWYLFSAIASGFMLEHALKGWCPPLPVFRRLGYRTTKEIDQERYALKALRGDFKDIEGKQPTRALEAARS